MEKMRKNLTKFVVEEIEAIREEKRKFKSEKYGSKIKCLVYINWLLKFLEMKVVHKPLDQLSEEMRIQQNSMKNILNKFFIATTKEGQEKPVYTRNNMLTDKLICHILILSLCYADFDFDATALVANMKIDIKK